MQGYVFSKGLGMTSPVSGMSSPQNYAGIGIYCNVIDPSKLPPDHPILQGNMPNCTVVGPNGPMPNYGPGYYTNNYGCGYGTQKKRITELTDSYMTRINQLLEGDDRELREYAASEVVQRFSEKMERKDDKALNILVNKMLLNPYDHKVRSRGLMLIETNLASGNEDTISVLQKIAQDPNLSDRDKGRIEKCYTQLCAKTEIVDTPIVPTYAGGSYE